MGRDGGRCLAVSGLYRFKLMATDPESLVTNVVVDTKGHVVDNSRSGDVAGCVKGQPLTIDVFVTRIGCTSKKGKSVDKLIADGDEAKLRKYGSLRAGRDVIFFSFGMGAGGRLGQQAEDTIHFFTNQLHGDEIRHNIIRRSWTRRITVGVLARQMQLVLGMQQKRSP
mmetsp:Transcript_40207/g.54684  ORF Transcript_40207/g.54684 Transcript_40207/m.54684 type:complete len:168 (-) Transcript_40207:391-894(-)